MPEISLTGVLDVTVIALVVPLGARRRVQGIRRDFGNVGNSS